ncbi:bacillithiol biosynthesis deacetylase BshB1 [Alteribacter natronophilus]|uniref:bacillithiol biosynthesis deacetylase BshB1 n=1 Tax=Alteribacter natronophilus TaxID=2583810 RepID=UPI00110DB8E1|nr:bacillithiol biosynthesis deacetylase BshB1 [Alteribacter natronophilus]TMW73573.1 bacillithiol biosynthesis deacetylase BshB1 [Alteribacter natronophilus]
MSDVKTDILAVGAHPDDVEIGMGGTIALHTSRGYSTSIINLTKAELSSNGTVETRQDEAEQAASLLGVEKLIQLDYPDRGLAECREEIVQKLTYHIRTLRPRHVFAPGIRDRHPDHTETGRLVKEAVFNAGIQKYNPSLGGPFRPEAFWYYQINGMTDPRYVVDISTVIDRKLEALQAYKSQFSSGPDTVATPLTDAYIERVRSREHITGQLIGVRYGEGFTSDGPLAVTNLFGSDSHEEI